MDNILIPLIKQAQRLFTTFEKTKPILINEDLPDSFFLALNNLEENCKSLNFTAQESSVNQSFEELLKIALNTKELATGISSHFARSGRATPQEIEELATKSSALSIAVKSAELDYLKNEITSLSSELATVKKELREASAEHSNQILLTTKEIASTRTQLSDIEQEISALRRMTGNEMQNVLNTTQETLSYLSEKRKEIDGLLEDSASRVIAVDYQKSAAVEKKAADNFRYGAIVCMILICIMLTEITINTLSSDFEWQRTLIRISLVFLFSVPAAYLARESAKHREQQYHFQQTSLDTKAIAPFISSLPDEEQHKIKSAVATKLFAGRDFSKFGSDPFPINIQELLIEISKKIDLSERNSKKTNS
ncbi:hypothetical protein B8W72_09755 [Pseudomonas putida]|uniref:Uncharacterized protein n=1 Tax=Pseudomonas putida TaxID=303 RepID=A0A1Y3L997_PSEPU|nr:hypothetical protein [Pseudomonas putida]OUM34738.1 hypothetical protein B8W72_09755 [Pseudomonas putida]